MRFPAFFLRKAIIYQSEKGIQTDMIGEYLDRIQCAL
jgi:hypothetical protein